MFKKPLALALALLSIIWLSAQKQVGSYSFKFEKNFLSKSDYDAYFLPDEKNRTLAFVLKDNKKADYVLFDQNFKTSFSFSTPIGNTIFENYQENYLGGTAENGVFHFVYQVTNKKLFGVNTTYQMETVDFNKKSVSNKLLFEIPKEEKLLVSFSDHDRYFTITANDKTSELNFYGLNSKGESLRKSIIIKVPEGQKKYNDELSEYYSGINIIKEDEENGIESAGPATKIYCTSDQLIITSDKTARQTRIVRINLNDFSVKETTIPYSAMEGYNEKDKPSANSFLKDGRLFFMFATDKMIKLFAYDESTAKMNTKFTFDENQGTDLFATPAINESGSGLSARQKELDNFKTIMRLIRGASEGLSLTETNKGQYVVTLGSYSKTTIIGGGGGGFSSGGHYIQTTRLNSAYSPTATSAPMNQQLTSSSIYIPGSSNNNYSHSTSSSYNSTYFKLIMDSSTLQIVKGKVPPSIKEQIRDYMNNANKKAIAIKQFQIGENQYYSYYDKDAEAYVIEQISLTKK